MVPSLPPTRKVATLAVLALLITASAAAVTYHRQDDTVRLAFGGKGGLATQSGHGPSAPDALLDIVQRTVDDYVASLEVLRPFHTFDATVQTPLLNITVHTDISGVNRTYIDTGYANITIDGLLSGVPETDVDALVANLTGQGYDLAEELLAEVTPSPSPSSSPSPSPSSSPDPVPVAEGPFYLEYVDDGHRMLVIHVAPLAERIDVIVLETEGFGGLHVTTTPFVVSHRSGDGTLLDLVVRNPVEATLGDLDKEIYVREVECSEGQCLPEATRDLQPHCTRTELCPDLPRTHITNLSHDGGPIVLPGELLHVWSEDAVHGGAGIEILGNGTFTLAGERWTGDPFGDTLVLNDANGEVLATLRLDLPRPDDPRLGFTLGGPLVTELAGDALAHHHDLDEYSIQIAWGPVRLANEQLYESFDALNGILAGTWSDADGTIRAAHITTLLDTEELLALTENIDGEIEAVVTPLQARLIYEAGRIDALAGGLVPWAQGLSGPAERALFDIVNVTTGEVEYQVRVVEGTAGCELTTLGCLGIVLGAAGDTLEEHGLPRPPSEVPDPEAFLGALPVESSEVIAYVNTMGGTVIGYLPGGTGPIPCLDGATPLTCLLTATPSELAGAAIGFIGGTAPPLSVVADEERDTLGIYDARGDAVAAYEGGTIHVAGHLARLGEDPLLTLTTPTGRTLCVDHTFDADAMAGGAWPSLEVGCDGIAGLRVVLQPGARYTIGPHGDLQELDIHHPADPHDPLLYYYDDGETTTILAHPTIGVDPVVVPSRLVHTSGNPVTGSSYRITIADESRTGPGVLRGVEVVRDAWLSSERAGRNLLPGTLATVVFDRTHGPQVDPWVSDGRNTLTASNDAFNGNRWLTGLEPNTWLVQTRDPNAKLDLLYRIGDLPHVSGSRIPFQVIGYNATTTATVYEASLSPSAISNFQSGSTMNFALAWTTRHGPIATTVVDDQGGAAYRYRIDTDRPTATLTTPDTSEDNTFTVSWSGSGERGSGLATYHVEVDDGTGWSTWVGGRHVTEPQEARFTGQPDATYRFRAKACDATGNCGAWTAVKTTTIAAAAPPPPANGPVLTVLAPADGATVSGFVALAWSVSHDAATEPLVTVEVRRSGDSDWTSLYSGHRTSTTWNTNQLWDGPHQIRYTASDGSRSDTETIQVQVDNGRPAPSLDIGTGHGTSGGTPGSVDPDDHEDDEKKRSPTVALPLVLLGLLGLAFVARRRR